MNRVTHFEIPAEDKARSTEFYSRVFGWQIAEIPVSMGGGTGTYTVATTTAVDPDTQAPVDPGAINGAIVERRGAITAPVIVLTVDSIDAHLKSVADAGGQVVEGKQEVGGMGFYAYVADPAGNVIGLWESAQAG